MRLTTRLNWLLISTTAAVAGCGWTPLSLEGAPPDVAPQAPALEAEETPAQSSDGGMVTGAAAVVGPAPQQVAAAAQTAVDAQAPDVFEVTEKAVWDGRPSMGNIWVEVPDALQPERVQIVNQDTGKVVVGAMFASSNARSVRVDRTGPIKLSSGAAAALGIAPNAPAVLTVTALRRETPEVQNEDSAVVMAQSAPPKRSDPLPQISVEDIALDAPIVASISPELDAPMPQDDSFVQVAEALSQESAHAIHSKLRSVQIDAELQEDYFDGLSVYRVFASKFSNRDLLAETLDNIRLTNSAEGDGDGTIIAEMPNFKATDPINPVWLDAGTYTSRNEALAVAQRLSRRSVPSEVCDVQRGSASVFRVFGGPASTGNAPTVSMNTAAFCAGVAAAEISAGPAFSAVKALSTSPLQDVPWTHREAPTKAVIPEGAVRIRVGEATGGLSLSVPQPFSKPIEIDVGGTIVTLPIDTPAERVKEIADALAILRNDKATQAAAPEVYLAP